MTPAAARTAHRDDVFDRAEALSLLRGDRNLLESLVRLFLELSPLVLGDLSHAQARGDAEKVARLAQRIESSANQLCAHRTATTARALAVAATHRGVGGTAPLVRCLAADLAQLHGRLREV